MPRRSRVLWAVVLTVLLGFAAKLGWVAYTRPRHAVVVAGSVVGALREPQEAQRVLDLVLADIPSDFQGYVNLQAQLEVRPLQPNEQLTIATAADITQALVRTIPDLLVATAITVNGRDIVAVSDVKAAQAVKEQILGEYRATILKDATEVEQVKFQETIDWRSKVVPRERVRTVEEAVSILKHGTDRLITYEVKSGDTGWDIARSYNVTTDQLAKANPATNLEYLKIGQVLNVTFREPHVHTQSVAKLLVREEIPFAEEIAETADLWPWQYEVVTPGQAGIRELTIREYRENGRIVKTEVIENKVVEAAKVQRARQGTKQIPALGTGSLVYPVKGTLTSYFGPRWGSFHSAIDIAAPTGTPILAADSGVVVFREWSGNYGHLLKIDHGGGRMVTWYAHLSRYNVRVGDTVRKGDVIGYVGNTGFSTGPHLHYEVHVDGRAVNPLNFYR